MKTLLQLIIYSLLFVQPIYAQTVDSLRSRIDKIIAGKNAEVGVAIIGNNGRDKVILRGDQHFPMQSVFKFHLACAVLAEVDKGKISLQQKIKITAKDLKEDTWSPIKNAYPKGTVLTVADLLSYSVSQSDNIACDLLFNLIGGPAVVDTYLKQLDLKDISIVATEKQMHQDWNVQFNNWTTPVAANEALAAFFYNANKKLSYESHAFLWKIMKATTTGQKRIRGQLPEELVVAHKTGSSGADSNGVTAAVNDIGIVFIPKKSPFFISVFITNSKENNDTNEKIIADIAKAAYDYFKIER